MELVVAYITALQSEKAKAELDRQYRYDMKYRATKGIVSRGQMIETVEQYGYKVEIRVSAVNEPAIMRRPRKGAVDCGNT